MADKLDQIFVNAKHWLVQSCPEFIQPWVSILLSIAFGVGGVYTWVNGQAKKRLAMLEEQLPDAVELIVRSFWSVVAAARGGRASASASPPTAA